ncbi:MAG: hypothetical protein FJ148_24405 [Deltaproteobacteria bacterium]|nr:hypothetical protein [Deltaproteobacteria bacterium]
MLIRVVLLSVGSLVVLIGCGAFFGLRERRPPLQLRGQDAARLPPPAAPRLGVNSVAGGSFDLSSTGASWYLNWSPTPTPDTPLEFVPMVCAYTDHAPVTPAYLATLEGQIRARPSAYPDGTLWLIGNEIGFRPQRDSRTAERYAADFHECRSMLLRINPTFRMAVGPVILSDSSTIIHEYVGGAGGLAYLAGVVAAYRKAYGVDIPADAFSATGHVLEGNGVDLAIFEAQIVRFRTFLADNGFREPEAIITEFGVAYGDPTFEELAHFLSKTTAFLDQERNPDIGCTKDDDRLIQRWAWFTAHPLGIVEKLRRLGFGALSLDLSQTSSFNSNGALNYLGRTYQDAVRSSAAPVTTHASR